jgi:hypothetical protein
LGDNGGIYSLAGFAYQIKVFVLSVLELKNGYTLEYETIDAKVKMIGCTETQLKQKIRDIVSMSSIQKYENIDTEIENKFNDFFIRYGVSEATYFLRIKEFLQQITVEILDAVGNGQPYLLTYENMSKIKNRIVTNYTDEKWEPSFSQFRRFGSY